MTRKRGRNTGGAKNEAESPEKKVKFMEVSNQETSIERNRVVAQNDRETSAQHFGQRAHEEKLKIDALVAPKVNVKKNKAEAEKDKNVKEDGEIALTDSNRLSNVSEEVVNWETINSVPQGKDCTIASTGSDLLSSASEQVENSETVTMILVPHEKDGALVALDSDRLSSVNKEFDNVESPIFLVSQEADKPSNKDECTFLVKGHGSNEQLSVESFEVLNEEEESLEILLLDLEDASVESPEQDKIIFHLEGTDDYVIVPTQSNIDSNSGNVAPAKLAERDHTVLQFERTDNCVIVPMQPSIDTNSYNIINKNIIDNVMSEESTVNAKNQNIENIFTDERIESSNQDEIKGDTFMSEKVTDKILIEAARKIHKKKPKSTKVKPTVSFKSKGKGRRQRKKLIQIEEASKLPLIKSTMCIEDEISCKICEQKIKMKLEGSSIFHFQFTLLNEDETDALIENIKTTYSVRCKNSHLCDFDFDFGAMKKDEMVPTLPSTKDTVHIKDEIQCTCGQKIKMKLEGTDVFHSKLVLLDEDETNVTIENIKTTYCVRCKNGHLCDFGLMKKDEIEHHLEEKVNFMEKLKTSLRNVWKKIKLMLRVPLE